MLGCGTLVVESAGERGQLVLRDIPHVEEVQRGSTGWPRPTRSAAAVAGSPDGREPAGRDRTDIRRPARERRARAARRAAERCSATRGQPRRPGSRCSSRPATVLAGHGLRQRGRRHAAFTDGDLVALHQAVGLVRDGSVDEPTALALARAIGRSTDRLASWQVQLLAEYRGRRPRGRPAVEAGRPARGPGGPSRRRPVRPAGAAGRLRLAPPPAAAVARLMADAAAGAGPVGRRPHGRASPTWCPSPGWSAGSTERELAALVQRFEALVLRHRRGARRAGDQDGRRRGAVRRRHGRRPPPRSALDIAEAMARGRRCCPTSGSASPPGPS